MTDDPVVFRGVRDRRWGALSNFHASPMLIDDREYPTVEHYFQACKTEDETEHELLRSAPTPLEAKRLGRKVRLRRDWERVKVEVMRRALLEKFRQNPDLRTVLLATGDRAIHEDAPHDAEWGWGGGTGRDLLGRLLVEVRAQMQEEQRVG